MSTLTPLEQRAAQLRKEKYGTDSLKWEPSPKQIITPSLDEAPPMSDKFYKQKLSEYREKFGISCFELEGQAKRAEPTLEDASIDRAREDMIGKKLKIATANYKKSPVRLYMEISKT